MIIEPPKPDTPEDKEGFYQAYSTYAWKFRLWLIAYGVSVPLLVINNPDLRAVVAKSPCSHWPLYLTLLGTFLQVCLAWVYKTAMWYYYDHEPNNPHCESGWRKFFWKISEDYRVEMSADALSFVLYTVSTVWLMGVVI